MNGAWPLTRGWQLSPIDLRTGKVVGFGPDSVVVNLDSVLVDKRSDTEVYYTLAGTIHIPAAATLPYDSVALVIRAAWDQGGNPGRYNNPVFDDAWRWDSAEDTTFRIILHPRFAGGYGHGRALGHDHGPLRRPLPARQCHGLRHRRV